MPIVSDSTWSEAVAKSGYMHCARVVLLRLAGCAQNPDPYVPVSPIIARHCVTCHANHPTHPGFDSPPLGVVLDSPADVKKHAIRIKMLAVTTDVMPLGKIGRATCRGRGCKYV